MYSETIKERNRDLIARAAKVREWYRREYVKVKRNPEWWLDEPLETRGGETMRNIQLAELRYKIRCENRRIARYQRRAY